MQFNKLTRKLLNSKRTAMFIILACLLFFSSLSQLPSQVPSVSAYDEVYVHPYMCDEAMKLLADPSAIKTEISAYLPSIKYGATREDQHDYIYASLTCDLPGIRTNTHFWDADNGPDDLVKPLGIVLPPPIPPTASGPYPNAYQKSLKLFEQALVWYPIDRSFAYQMLGHVAHLLQDMSVPAHAHEDYHPGQLVPGGDDCYENWYLNSGAYLNWGTGSVVGEELITFPHDVEAEMRRGNWSAGLYYLMYTTNQRADYFASDDVPGDMDDPMGWMNYPSDWSHGPRTLQQIEDNDDELFLGVSLGDAFSNDNDNDGDLSFIASKTVPYCLRAVATLYKMFYEATHPPIATISIDYADLDDNDNADYRNVYLDLTYDVGAPDYFRDLEAWYGNSEPEPATQRWQGIGSSPGKHRKDWVLSEGDGPKKVYYQVRNLMGLRTTVSADVYLEEKGMPQQFDFTFSAEGVTDRRADVSFYLKYIQKKDTSGDGDLEFYLKWHVDDGTEPGRLIPTTVEPSEGLYYEIGPNYGEGPNVLPVSALTNDMIDDMGGYSFVGLPYEPFDNSLLGSCQVNPGGRVRLRTHGYDYDPWPNPDDDLGNVWTGTYQVPSDDGTYDLIPEGWKWFEQTSKGGINSYYRIYVRIVAKVSSTPVYGFEWDTINDEPYHGVVWYTEGTFEERKQYIRSPDDLPGPPPYGPYEKWFANILNIDPENPAIGYEMRGQELWAWIVDDHPDMVIIGFSPVYLLITDPDGQLSGTRVIQAWDEETRTLGWKLESFDQIPGVTVLEFADPNSIDVNGDGDPDSIVVFDDRKLGEYQINVTSKILGAPYSIAVSTYAIGFESQFKFLVEDETVRAINRSESYVIRSDYNGLNLPPTANAGGPYRANEGLVTFDASGSTDPDGDSLQYRWDFGCDGTWEYGWSSNPTVSHLFLDDGFYNATVQVSDGTFTDTDIAFADISNAAPTVVAVCYNPLAAPGEEVRFQMFNITDPGVLDTHTIVWHFGDGATAAGIFDPAHVYADARKYNVNVTVTDDDGAVGVAAWTVNTGVNVTVEPLVMCVPPGQRVTYSVTVRHLGTGLPRYNLELTGLDPEWYSLSATSVETGSDQPITVTLTVLPPSDTPIGAYGFTVAAKSQTNPATFDAADADVIVFVTKPLATDVNKDGKVNIIDLAIAAKGFGKRPGEPYWNEAADLDKNGVINIFDIARIAKDFGKTFGLP
jgi:PKD repeat protein